MATYPENFILFQISISPHANGYLARFRSKLGEEDHVFVNALTDSELGAIRTARARAGAYMVEGRLRGGASELTPANQPASADWEYSSPLEQMEKVGDALVKRAFSEDARSLLRSCFDMANLNKSYVRIRLELNGVPELQKYPWDFMYLRREGFLCVNRNAALVQYCKSNRPMQELLSIEPLRVLVMTSLTEGSVPIDIESEWQRIESGLKPMIESKRVEIERLHSASLQDLVNKLNRKDFHVVHFVGHGDVDTDKQESFLYMHGPDGSTTRVSALEIGRALFDSTVRIVFLNTCKGAGHSAGIVSSGIAQTLVGEGISAVIAMNDSIYDQSAQILAQEFYTHLSSGDPVDVALTKARKSIFTFCSEGLDWGTPVLFMRPEDGRVFSSIDEVADRFESKSYSERYKIIKLIGDGRRGKIFHAVDTTIQRDVALRVCKGDSFSTQNKQRELAREARLAAGVDSHHVAKIWDVSFEGSDLFVSMEYVQGPDLRSEIPTSSIEKAITIIKQLGKGILLAHQKGIIHGDLKPENIRMSETGEPKILDFGISEVINAEAMDQAGHLIGTVHNLSPEHLNGKVLDPRSDLFSFGTICYELLTGYRPFEGQNSSAVVYSILHEDHIDPTERRAELPIWTNLFVGRLLSKNPGDRFQDMRESLDFLDSCRQGTRNTVTESYKPRQQKVTVVELRNLSGDANWEYFCQGFTEDVIRELRRRTKLTVNAEPATNVERDIKDVFRRCRSDFVVAGSLLSWQDKVKLNLAIYGSDGNQLVSVENHVSDAKDLFELLAKATEHTSLTLANATGAAVVDVTASRTINVTAYDCFLRAKSYYQSSTEQGFKHAIQLYEKALEIDPNYALAHAGLSDVYTSQYMAWYDHSQTRIELAKQEAKRALALDPKLPEAHRSLGRYYQFIGKHQEAEQSLLRSVEFDPRYSLGYRALGWLKRGMGKYDEAAQFARKALELAPTDLETLLLHSLILMDKRQFTPALATLQRTIELGPDYGRAYNSLGSVYMKLGVFDLALENFLSPAALEGDPNSYIEAGYLLLANGKLSDAKQKLNESVRLGYFTFVAHYFLGLVEKLEGNLESAKSHFDTVLKLTLSETTTPSETDIHSAAFHAMALASLGNADANKLLSVLEQKAEGQGEVLFSVARAYAVLGDLQKAREILERSFNSHAGPTPREISIDPHFTALRN